MTVPVAHKDGGERHHKLHDVGEGAVDGPRQPFPGLEAFVTVRRMPRIHLHVVGVRRREDDGQAVDHHGHDDGGGSGEPRHVWLDDSHVAVDGDARQGQRRHVDRNPLGSVSGEMISFTFCIHY